MVSIDSLPLKFFASERDIELAMQEWDRYHFENGLIYRPEVTSKNLAIVAEYINSFELDCEIQKVIENYIDNAIRKADMSQRLEYADAPQSKEEKQLRLDVKSAIEFYEEGLYDSYDYMIDFGAKRNGYSHNDFEDLVTDVRERGWDND